MELDSRLKAALLIASAEAVIPRGEVIPPVYSPRVSFPGSKAGLSAHNASIRAYLGARRSNKARGPVS